MLKHKRSPKHVRLDHAKTFEQQKKRSAYDIKRDNDAFELEHLLLATQASGNGGAEKGFASNR